MGLLDRYLAKIGVSSYLNLNTEERETFKQWQGALAGRRLTDPEIEAFLANQLEDAMKKITTSKLGKRDDTFLKMKIAFVRDVQNFLNMPKLEKKLAEAGITRMIDTLPS